MHKINKSPKGSVNLEYFLADLNRGLIARVMKEKDKFKRNEMSTFINGLIDDLNKEDKVLVPTDKTNGCVSMTLAQYKMEMNKALNEVADKIETNEVKSIKNQAMEVLKSLEHKLSKN